MRKIVLAEKSGFCFGVNRSYETAIEKSNNRDYRTYTLGPLIHNEDFIRHLKEKGVEPVEFDDIKKLEKSDEIIIRSHGVPEEIELILEEKFNNVINCTCPFVKRVQNKAREYYEKDYQIIIVGDKNHPEIIGVNGWCNNSAFITRYTRDIHTFDKNICILSQTTEKKDVWDKIVKTVKQLNKNKEVVAINTICNATKERQLSAKKLAQNTPAVIVIGGKTSSNTKKLYDICKTHCSNTQLVSTVADIQLELLKDINTVGVIAGASTPKWLIEDIVVFLKIS
ncbi:4-hydroxy-3-methylbut-2-enyl diphosphate reductase [Oceanirhabdus sp. W0125-5]|uniref:4-hydroxy-3-methylbut-2-enyl diphosphate reductase n=1 Tax=Oceanirhabdus sp. W0125-5 TaxID=2999116 RepID=UPI0022F2C7E5|nr:4-hydroxy-3-methylbut-2-enyl diphosphate reductase [Oceanirhabdus sp. W0125-5]WBW96030.1 4-hydroxy-3-methylbut-2-enyl diphosphate reductase [Oceanirhabdus sp. W0125-5]